MTFDPMTDESFSRGLLGGLVAALLVVVVVAVLGEVLPTTRIRLMIWLGMGVGGIWCVRTAMQAMSGGMEGFKITAIAWGLSIVAAILGTMAWPYFRGDFTLGGFMSEGTTSPEGQLVFLVAVQVIGATLMACFGGDD